MSDPDRGPDVEIRGAWIDGHLLVNGQKLDWPIIGVSWSMHPDGTDGLPTLKLEIQCNTIKIDHRWPETREVSK